MNTEIKEALSLEDGAEVVYIEGTRTGYSPAQVARYTCTVGELINLLSDYDEDTIIVLRNDNGYTYGEINSGTIGMGNWNEDEEELEV